MNNDYHLIRRGKENERKTNVHLISRYSKSLQPNCEERQLFKKTYFDAEVDELKLALYFIDIMCNYTEALRRISEISTSAKKCCLLLNGLCFTDSMNLLVPANKQPIYSQL